MADGGGGVILESASGVAVTENGLKLACISLTRFGFLTDEPNGDATSE